MKPGKDFIGVGCAVMIINEGKILLLERTKEKPETWSLPGGSIRVGEKREDAAKREVKEELGLEVEVKNMISVIETFEERGHWITFGFTVDVVKGKPRNMEPENCRKIQWFPLQELPENIFLPSRRIIEDYVKISNFYRQQLKDGIKNARLGAEK